MNFAKINFGVALMVFCCISLSYSLKCYVCSNREHCKKPELLKCNTILANATQRHLITYHSLVPGSAITNSFDCFKEYIYSNRTGDVSYKGCINSNIQGCSYPLTPYYASSNRTCKQCNKDGCNPAGRANVDVIAVIASIIVAVILRYVCH